ncbi:hypothetical protein VNI00_009024 [Paramarasmius palmivorus]|uniref:BTB domain-containing protein n=1 Tax=Paramarasmius palmivorus TaxID=297713 RepID=A0AAW0CRC3_9AGAR
MGSNTSPSSCPVKGCVIPVDVVIKSSDNHTFGAHAKNLESFSEGFPLSGSVKANDQEPVELTETADILRLFLAFTHNSSSPDLSGYDIDVIMSLAEAADKYGNHFAMAVCRKSMRLLADVSTQNALRILKFKAIHADNEDIDHIAELTMAFDIVHVVQFFGDYLMEFRIWLLYQQAYDKRAKEYHNTVSREFTPAHQRNHGIISVCPNSPTFKDKVILTVACLQKTKLPKPELFQEVVDAAEFLVDCICGLDEWLNNVKQTLENRPKWSDYAKGSS